MKDKRMYESSVYHLCAGPQLDDFVVINSYNEYLAYFLRLKADHKGTRYLYTTKDQRGVYHHYLRVVNVP